MNIGDYVRTKYGISKIENISPNEYDKEHDYIELENCVFDGLDTQGFFTTDEIIKSSPNIIDLIEVGDYVNGAKVVRVKTDENGTKWVYTNNENAYGYKSNEIKSIITYEQFKAMEYKL